MTRALLLAPALLLAACASDGSDAPDPDAIAAGAEAEAAEETDGLNIDLDGVQLGADIEGELVDAVTTENGQIEVGVTDAVLYSRLSESLRAEIEAEMEEETADETGLGGTIARAVTGAVAEGLGTAVSIPLSDVRDIRYDGEQGRLVIEMADGETSPFDSMKSDDEPVMTQFTPEAGRRLASAFDKARAR